MGTKLTRTLGVEDGQRVYIYSLPGDSYKWPVPVSDIKSGMITSEDVYNRLIDIRPHVLDRASRD